jgi:hypothetical protein
MMTLRANPADIFGKPLLSDRGAALLCYGRQFRAYFHCVWHLLENYGSNKCFGTFVRRLTFATGDQDFSETIVRTIDDLAVIAEMRQLNEQLFYKFSEEFGIVSGEWEGFRFAPERTGRG